MDNLHFSSMKVNRNRVFRNIIFSCLEILQMNKSEDVGWNPNHTFVIFVNHPLIVSKFSLSSFLHPRQSDRLSMMLHGLLFSPCFSDSRDIYQRLTQSALNPVAWVYSKLFLTFLSVRFWNIYLRGTVYLFQHQWLKNWNNFHYHDCIYQNCYSAWIESKQ